MNEQEKKSLDTVVDYLYLDEISDWRAQGEPKEGHIFNDLYVLAHTLKRVGDEQKNWDKLLVRVAEMMNDRIMTMKETDALDGKTKTPLVEYLHWALEECCTNDGLIISVEK